MRPRGDLSREDPIPRDAFVNAVRAARFTSLRCILVTLTSSPAFGGSSERALMSEKVENNSPCERTLVLNLSIAR